MISSFYVTLVEILHEKFGTDKEFDSNEAVKALRSGCDYLKKMPIANSRYYLSALRKVGVLVTVKHGSKNGGVLYINQLSKPFMENEPRLARLVTGVQYQIKTTEIPEVQEQNPNVKYFVGEIMFDTINDAVAYCKSHIIKIKRKKIIWE
ncbi:hypothetical protein Henu11_gp30 [Shigella phage Henu11]|uniref:Uncharacterized protein n=1 Tax=Shigella phage Henu11 TaxID=2930391 RepID=A0A9E7SQD0_9CAUD|nr:hypothetical protein Henu11_gp30 [Shigella phage Henu11]